MRRRGRLAALAALVVTVVTAAAFTSAAQGVHTSKGPKSGPSAAACQLGDKGQVKHVIYLQFDNVHFLRDNPNVPSDVEQMPHLYNFLKDNGTFDTNDHTILISHTGGGILSSLTGLYPDRHGQAVSNSYGFFRPDNSVGFSSSFKYWTDQTDAVNDPNYNMVNADSPALGGTGAVRNAPAPWVPYARAGCDVGNVGVANTVLENTATDATGDMTKVFGTGSPEWNDAVASNAAPSNTAARAAAQTDYVGIAIHCAAGGGICNANAANARPDSLPDEKGGYTGYKALFGGKYVNKAINNGSTCVNDTSGAPIVDPFNRCGFPGFDGMYAKNTLGEVAQMQEAGVPVTFGYISDAHDFHGNSGNAHVAYGPGEQGYHQQLVDYDKAFADFFARLQSDGIDKDNTVFVVTVEEGDHFAGTAPDGPCNGVTQFCTYNKGHVTEVNGDLKKLVATYNASHGTSATTNFSVHSDMAPNVYITGNPARDSATARTLEKAMSDMNVTDPLNGQKAKLFVAMADPVEEKLLHMVTADPARTPSFTPFAQGDFFLNASSTTPCANNDLDNCVFLPNTAPPASTFAWNHGGIQPEIATTWIGWVGPGIEKKGQTDRVWTDHTDIRPTMLALLGLTDDYVSDGRVVTEFLKGDATGKALDAHHETLERLGAMYKQINASFGNFSLNTLCASTGALASNTLGDSTYANTETELQSLGNQRDALANDIRAALWNAEFNDQKLDEKQARDWIKLGQGYLDQAAALCSRFSSAPSDRNGQKLQKIDHIVVIYEENHSFDNLFGGWEGVNGLNNVHQTGVGDHVTQVNEAGNAYSCLKQNDANLNDATRFPQTCVDATPGTPGGPFTSHFPNAPFTIDDYIKPTDKTCPPSPLVAFSQPNGWLKGTGSPGGCTRDIVHRFYHEQYQLDGG
ncbi:MAG: alkaline phosphatase family protein, partial [Gaiellaceae bacterium]